MSWLVNNNNNQYLLKATSGCAKCRILHNPHHDPLKYMMLALSLIDSWGTQGYISGAWEYDSTSLCCFSTLMATLLRYRTCQVTSYLPWVSKATPFFCHVFLSRPVWILIRSLTRGGGIAALGNGWFRDLGGELSRSRVLSRPGRNGCPPATSPSPGCPHPEHSCLWGY